MSGLTPSQTVGPYFALGLDWPQGTRLAAAGTPGEPITIAGQIFDGDGAPIPDALIEIWQADAAGHYYGAAQRAWRGAGRCAVDADGRFCFQTIKPGAVSEADGTVQAPHANVLVFARGLLLHLHTRIYFADETTANAVDPVLAVVPVERRGSLLARRQGGIYCFDIHLQGPTETVFFDV